MMGTGAGGGVGTEYGVRSTEYGGGCEPPSRKTRIGMSSFGARSVSEGLVYFFRSPKRKRGLSQDPRLRFGLRKKSLLRRRLGQLLAAVGQQPRELVGRQPRVVHQEPPISVRMNPSRSSPVQPSATSRRPIASSARSRSLSVCREMRPLVDARAGAPPPAGSCRYRHRRPRISRSASVDRAEPVPGGGDERLVPPRVGLRPASAAAWRCRRPAGAVTPRVLAELRQVPVLEHPDQPRGERPLAVVPGQDRPCRRPSPGRSELAPELGDGRLLPLLVPRVQPARPAPAGRPPAGSRDRPVRAANSSSHAGFSPSRQPTHTSQSRAYSPSR